MENRRAQDRLPETNRVAVTILQADAAPELVNVTLFCPTEDVSADGLRLRTHRRLPVGSRLLLRIALLKPLRTFTHQGETAWFRPQAGESGVFLQGIRFTVLQPGAESAWRDQVKRKLALLFPPEEEAAEEAED